MHWLGSEDHKCARCIYCCGGVDRRGERGLRRSLHYDGDRDAAVVRVPFYHRYANTHCTDRALLSGRGKVSIPPGGSFRSRGHRCEAARRRLPALGRPAKESTTVPGSRLDSPTSPGTAAVTTFAAAVTPAAQVLGLWAVWGQPPVQRLGAAALSVSPAANRMRWDGSTGRLFRGGTAGAEINHCTDVGIYYRETFQVQWQRHRWRRY